MAEKTDANPKGRNVTGDFNEGRYWDYGERFESKGRDYNKSKTVLADHTLEDGRFYSQIYYQHDDKVKEFTREEVDAINAEEAELNEQCLQEALDDGFIEIPITFRNTDGELVDMKAWVHPTYRPSNTPGFEEEFGMKYNIYVPSYNRAKGNLTGSMLQRHGVKCWYFCIDPSQYSEYKKYWPKERIILRDIRFRDPSMLEMGSSLIRPNYMSGTAGIYNNLLSFSRSMGEKKYWTMDDDFICMGMKGIKGDKIGSAKNGYDKMNYYQCPNLREKFGWDMHRFMRVQEGVAEQIRNHGFFGLEKFGIVYNFPIFWKAGTRVYSFYLSDNRTQVKHKFCMNNDVIGSLEQSKRQTPPILMDGICYHSQPTQRGGGLTEQYKLLGTLEKGKVLVKSNPNYARISSIFSRIHHTTDYSVTKKMRFVDGPKDDSEAPLYFRAGD